MTANWTPQGFVTVDGTRLEIACFGPAPDQAPTLVLLHEGLGCAALWRDFPERLAQATGFGVFVYSRAGYGQSDPVPLPRPLDYMTREAVNVLPKVLDAVGVRDAVLLGHSDGATIAAIHAGTVPDKRVRGLVVLAPHFFTEEIGLTEIARAKVAYETTDLPQKMARYHRDPDNAFWGWNGAWLDPGFKAWNVAHVLDSLTVPTLAIQGAQDQYGTLAQIEVIARRSPSPVSQVILPDTRHAPHLEAPEATLAATVQFCAGLSPI